MLVILETLQAYSYEIAAIAAVLAIMVKAAAFYKSVVSALYFKEDAAIDAYEEWKDNRFYDDEDSFYIWSFEDYLQKHLNQWKQETPLMTLLAANLITRARLADRLVKKPLPLANPAFYVQAA